MDTFITRLTLQGFKSFNRRISIPLTNGFMIFCGPNASGKCLEYNSLVQLADGSLIPIGKLVETRLKNSKKVKKLKDGFYTDENPKNIEIITLNPRTLKLEKRKVSAFVKRRCPPTLIKVKTRSGRKIVATKYHPFFTISNGNLVSTSAEKLRKGLKIATPRILPIKSSSHSIDFLNLFRPEDKVYVPWKFEIWSFIKSLERKYGGRMKLSRKLGIPYDILDSFRSKQSINFYYLSKLLQDNGYGIEKLKEFEIKLKSKNGNVLMKPVWNLTNSLARFFGYIISEGSSPSSTSQLRFVNSSQPLLEDFSNLTEKLWGLKAHSCNYKPNATDSMIYSKTLKTFLDKVFGFKVGMNAREKRTPPQIFKSDENIISSFLGGLIEGDGYLYAKVKKSGHTCYLEFYTSSEGLAFDVSTLFLRLGIIPSLKEKLFKGKTYHVLKIYGIDNLRKISRLIPFKSPEKIRALDELKNWDIKSGRNIDLIPNVNSLVKLAVKLAKINVKKIRKRCLKLQAYYEDRCEATREGLKEVVKVIEKSGKLTKEVKCILDIIQLFANSDVFWDEITEVKEIKPKDKWVYDLSVDKTHNFVANNFIVHNSNLVDSICFALGRTSAKSMRADRLHELIFHGTPKKSPAKYASVTLYFDNSKRVFPFDEDEISITRKVNRKGVCVYKINGRTTTREKVLELLSTVRLRPTGHNIILQGDVTNVIEMNPVERRVIIDEISGIAEYNEKKEKAKRDLDAVDQKLKEAEIIISERYDIFKRLEEERNAAIRYQNLQKQLKVLKASYARKKFLKLKDKIGRISDKIVKKEEQNKRLIEDIDEVEEKLERTEASIRDVADKLIDLSKKVEIEKEVSDLRSKLLVKKEKIEANLREIERLDKLIEKLEALESRKAEMVGRIPRAVQSILRLNLNGVYGTVASLISVPEEYRIAVEVAAGSHLHDIVVKDDDVASYCIEYLKREKIGRATFLPLNKIRPILFSDNKLLKKPGVVGVASKLIKFDTKFMRAMEFVFGNTLVVENLDAARAIGIGKARMVTLDGDLIERSGAMVGGYYIKTHPIALETATRKEIDRYINLRKDLEQEVNALKLDVEELEKRIKDLATAETTKEFIDLEKLRIASEREVDELRAKRKSLQEKRVNLEMELNRLKVKKAKLETELENVKKEVEQYGDIKYLDEKLSTLRKFIEKTETELASIGLVNLKAIEEYERFKSEFDEYKNKYEKILEEKKAVLEMIEEIEEKRREVFNKCLQAVSKEFNNIFLKMTGGTASLELENPLDLESGLIIQANPKGKRLLSIDAMSGGEKSLTALAFLFAIQRYKPAPFYILDEVDAALDKENSKIVAELIRKLSRDAQFIVITHNDQTIKYGDRVFGVSMIDGESKIVGLEMPKE